ncbi:MAG: M90 family metallopeptidase [Ferruginibacter sp.]
MIPFVLLIAVICFTIYFLSGKEKNKIIEPVFINTSLLDKNVLFYSKLIPEEKKQFEKNVADFLADVKITGIDTNVEELDRILIAAAAVIPIFHFKQWKYYNLQEVLLYSDAINMNFESAGNVDRNILGMVGSGVYEGKMFLSKHSLHEGFDNKMDKSNTAIHEFVHLIDKSDGDTDGVPAILLDKKFVLPWIELIQKQMQQIANNKSDINPYATMNKAEFLSVTAEYFFERPDLLEKNHPELYAMLKQMFEPAL